MKHLDRADSALRGQQTRQVGGMIAIQNNQRPLAPHKRPSYAAINDVVVDLGLPLFSFVDAFGQLNTDNTNCCLNEETSTYD